MLRVFDPVGSQPISRWRWTGCGLPHKGTASAPQTWVLSGLNTWPARAPTNASLQPHGWPRIARGRHGSLLLCRTTLAFATPRRLTRRTPHPPQYVLRRRKAPDNLPLVAYASRWRARSAHRLDSSSLERESELFGAAARTAGGGGGKERAARNERSSDWPQGARSAPPNPDAL